MLRINTSFVTITNVQTCREILSAYTPAKLMTIARNPDLKCCEAWTVTVYFMHLELRRELKENYMKEGESKVGIGL